MEGTCSSVSRLSTSSPSRPPKMPYSCWMMTTSQLLSRIAAAAGPCGSPATMVPTTSAAGSLNPRGPPGNSNSRITEAVSPYPALSCRSIMAVISDKVKVARPHWVGGYVLTKPKRIVTADTFHKGGAAQNSGGTSRGRGGRGESVYHGAICGGLGAAWEAAGALRRAPGTVELPHNSLSRGRNVHLWNGPLLPRGEFETVPQRVRRWGGRPVAGAHRAEIRSAHSLARVGGVAREPR